MTLQEILERIQDIIYQEGNVQELDLPQALNYVLLNFGSPDKVERATALVVRPLDSSQ